MKFRAINNSSTVTIKREASLEQKQFSRTKPKIRNGIFRR